MYTERERETQFSWADKLYTLLNKRCHVIDTSVAIPSQINEIGVPITCSAVGWGCSLHY